MEPTHDDRFQELTSVWAEGLGIHPPSFDGKRGKITPSLRFIAFCRRRNRFQASPRIPPVTKLRSHRDSSRLSSN